MNSGQQSFRSLGGASKAPRGAIGMRLCNELEGLLQGVASDGLIKTDEAARIAAWLQKNEQFADVYPFVELATKLRRVLSDGLLTIDESEDLLFVISKYTTVNPYFDQIRAGLQVLMGLLAGYAADARINEAEIRHLQQWVEDWKHLRSLWPYDECETIVTWMIANGRIAEDAGLLLELSKCVPVDGGPITEPPALTLAGICSTDPEITFSDRQFVFTGESQKCERSDMEARVYERMGHAHPRVTLKTNYLVVCDEGNPHWAFSCYGRKVEKAFELRREGHHVVIVHESDFWDALR
jgi:hypothetical protein